MNKHGKPCLWILNVSYRQNWLDLIKINQFWKNVEGGQLFREYTDERQDIYGLPLHRDFEREFYYSTDKLKCLNYVNLSLGPFKESLLNSFQYNAETDFYICWHMAVKGCFFQFSCASTI